MKKRISIIFLAIILLNITGCIKRDNLEDIDIYTTVYPIEYITDKLYGGHSNIYSIYPDGIIVDDYTLTSKQIKDYSAGDMFIFNGLDTEKSYVIPMFNYNKDIKIIDTAMSMEYAYSKEELWLDPSNFLMLAQNIRKGFKEYINNGYLKNEIDENYETLKVEVSALDAKLKLMIESSTDKTILVGNNVYNFLTKYGLNVISIDANNNISEKTLMEIETLINSGNIKYIYLMQNADTTELIDRLIEENKITPIYLHDITNITEEERDGREDYLSLMYDNIELLKNELYD